jgi:hypothetical protein
MPSDLPPLDFKEDVEKYEAFEEKKEVSFPKCNHSKAKIVDGRLRCTCGASWIDKLSNLLKLQELLSRQ